MSEFVDSREMLYLYYPDVMSQGHELNIKSKFANISLEVIYWKQTALLM